MTITKNERRKMYYQKLIDAGFHFTVARALRDRGKKLIEYLCELNQSGDHTDQVVIDKMLKTLGIEQ
jgi:hypothetical protein